MLLRAWTTIGTLLGALGVICGAFGAHALRGRVTPEDLAIWHTAVDYQLWHVLALLLAVRTTSSRAVPCLLCTGIVIFSGSLYLLVLTGHRWLGAVTPLGGVCLIGAWLLWAYVTARNADSQ